MLKALIFDFDGLMIDTEYTWYPIFRDYFVEYHDYDMQMSDFLLCIGGGNEKFMEVLRKDLGDDFDEAHFAEYKNPAFKVASSNLPMMIGVENLIKSAKEAGFKIAMATSSRHPHAHNHLIRWNILSYFDVVVTGDMVDNLKPQPDLFLKALDKLDLEAHEVFVFEDSYNGLLAANSASIDAIIVPNEVTKHSNFETQFRLFNSLEEVNVELLKGFKK